ncbi:MAG: hypothetical protein ACO1OF_15585 [Adhaeribacter sp.]
MILTYKDLLSQKGNVTPTYLELFNTKEWRERRTPILERDDFYCTDCGFSETFNHNGELITFDKSKKLDIEHYYERIVADHPCVSNRKINLHVHHKHYVLDTLPWQYNDDDLVTLCDLCHWNLHQNVEVKIYQKDGGNLYKLSYTPCSRCNGAGFLPQYSYVQNGVCFECGGLKYQELYKGGLKF